jgi:hypothetical protein
MCFAVLDRRHEVLDVQEVVPAERAPHFVHHAFGARPEDVAEFRPVAVFSGEQWVYPGRRGRAVPVLEEQEARANAAAAAAHWRPGEVLEVTAFAFLEFKMWAMRLDFLITFMSQ